MKKQIGKEIERIAICFLLCFFIPQVSKAQWIQTKGMSPTVRAHSLAISGKNLFAGTNQGVFLTADSGTTWQEVNSGLPDLDIWSLSANETTLFALNSNLGLFISKTNGRTWSVVNVNSLSDNNLFTSVNVERNIVIATRGYGGAFISKDTGDNWAYSSMISNTTVNEINLGLIGGTIVVGMPEGVFISKDSGSSWIFSGLPTFAERRLVIMDTTIFIGTAGYGIAFSKNLGISWTSANIGNTGKTRWSSVDFAVSGTNLFACYADGWVSISTNTGVTWQTIDTGRVKPDTVWFYAFVVSGTNLFAGTAAGVWKLPLTNIISVKKPHSFIDDKHFDYKNSLNMLRYVLPEHCYVSVNYYDLKGRLSASLVNRVQAPGDYSLALPHSKLAHGAYTQVFMAGSFIKRELVVIPK